MPVANSTEALLFKARSEMIGAIVIDQIEEAKPLPLDPQVEMNFFTARSALITDIIIEQLPAAKEP